MDPRHDPARPSDIDAAGMEARMDTIRLKHLLDPASLSERELMCIQIEQHGFGCAPARRAGGRGATGD